MTTPRPDVQEPTTKRRFVLTVEVPDDPDTIRRMSQEIVHELSEIYTQPWETVTVAPIDGMALSKLDLAIELWRTTADGDPLADAAQEILNNLKGK